MSSDEDTELGRFGHHPNPAIDFCMEVEKLEGESYNMRAGIPSAMPLTTFRERVAKAMQFRVGGDLNAINAKGVLRSIEAVWGATPPAPAPSTAAGEPPKHRGEYSTHQQQADACAALATPPAQSVEKYVPADIAEWRALARTVGDFLHKKGEAFRCGEGAKLLDAYEAVLARPEMGTAPPAPSVPWEEQAAQIRQEALEDAARLCDATSRDCGPVTNEYMRGCKNEALSLAERFRALARSEKGEEGK